MSVSNEFVNPAGSSTTGATAESTASSWWDRADAFIGVIGDRLNPILVKETRQALKSRQFTATFWLLLVFGAGWSFVGIMLRMPAVYYLPSGPDMLIGYFVILCVPLLLVVPFSAYRSLAMEKEDGTYELLSITSLSARHIVTGKLGSALMQMLVYYAALAPCIAFTYLLRGMDLGTILIILVGTFLVSLLLSAIGLTFAGMQQSKQWQALSSVLLLLLLISVAWGWGIGMISLIFTGRTAMDTVDFWYGVGFFLTMYTSFLALIITAAAAQNSFATDNRSTKIRAMMVAQLALFAGWMIFLWLKYEQGEFAIVIMTIGGIFWAIYGAMLTGEVAELSPRARRDLPQSFMGRTFLTWFNPGSATGYMLAVTTFATFVLTITSINTYGTASGNGGFYNPTQANTFGILMWSYMAFYLGLGRLIIAGLRKLSYFGLAAVVLIHVLLLVLSAAIPTFFQFWLEGFREPDYSTIQAMNWWWSLLEAGRRNTVMMDPTLYIASAAGLSMFALHLVLAAREVEKTRLATPERVTQDDYRAHGLATQFAGASMADIEPDKAADAIDVFADDDALDLN